MEDPNIAQDVFDKFSTFVVWELDSVKICKVSKIFNKDCNLSTKSLY